MAARVTYIQDSKDVNDDDSMGKRASSKIAHGVLEDVENTQNDN